MLDKPGRNDPCPCGSGKKYKKCCLSKENEPRKLNAKVIKSGSRFPSPHSQDLMERTFGRKSEDKPKEETSAEENLES